jgi:hypothetical protein
MSGLQMQHASDTHDRSDAVADVQENPVFSGTPEKGTELQTVPLDTIVHHRDCTVPHVNIRVLEQLCLDDGDDCLILRR